MSDDCHYMIDCETWGTADDAVIRMIALAEFDPCSGEIGEALLIDATTSIDSQLEAGRTIDSSTVSWWAKQSPRLSEMCFPALQADMTACWSIERADYGHEIADALGAFLPDREWFELQKTESLVWSRGLLDLHWLRSLWGAKNIPWGYWQERDVRTLDGLVGKVNSTVPHWPAADVEAQIGQVVEAYALRSMMAVAAGGGR